MPELKKKLQLKADNELLLLKIPKDIEKALLQEGCNITSAEKVHATGAHGAVLLFVQSKQQLEQSAQKAVALLKPEGMLWIAYPKKSSGIKTDLTREEGWSTMAALDYEAVRQVALNDIWSALRFRHKLERKAASSFGVDLPGIDRKTRTVMVPDDIQKALEGAGLSELFSQLAFTYRKEYVVSVLKAKRPETRANRILKVVEQLARKQEV